MKDINKTIAFILGSLLLFAILPLPYGYYTFLRLTVFLGASFLAYKSYEQEMTGWTLFLGGVSLLFNPLFPVYLSKEFWMPIDLICGALFFYIGFNMKKNKHE